MYRKQAYSEVSECFRFNNAFELEGTAFENNYAGSSLIDSLNTFSDEWYMNINYSYWLLNEGRKNASFTIKGRDKVFIKLDSQVIMFPYLISKT